MSAILESITDRLKSHNLFGAFRLQKIDAFVLARHLSVKHPEKIFLASSDLAQSHSDGVGHSSFQCANPSHLESAAPP